MTLVVPRMLAKITDPHLPLFQRTAIAFRMFVFSVSFVILKCSYCLPNPLSFCKFHCPLCCAVLLCALVNYLVNRSAYDEITALCYVPHRLKSQRFSYISLLSKIFDYLVLTQKAQDLVPPSLCLKPP